MIVNLDHIQLAHPAGAEDAMRGFYCGLLGMVEIAKPDALQGRGGFWAVAGSTQVHFGVDPQFTPAAKAHPAFIVADLALLAKRLTAAGAAVRWDTSLSDVRRFFTDDPVGNRVELMATPDQNAA
jgi:extradiol dioxygenase family protein